MKLQFRLALLSLMVTSVAAHASVTATEAGKLKTELTPLGAEKAGNKDGSIPAWTGGFTTPIPGDKVGSGRRGNPFEGEKPLFSITAGNFSQYTDRLTEGTQAMFSKYPDYRIDVYPTHRTAAAPQWVYDNTARNATRAKLKDGIVEGAYGGIPFPIPQSAEEVMWNHRLRWRGTSIEMTDTHYQINSGGRPVMATDGIFQQQMPYYFQDGSAEEFYKSRSPFWMIRLLNAGPPLRAGEGGIGTQRLDGAKDEAWVYLVGQRRVRKLPDACCDTPAPATAGVMSFDELDTWQGPLDRFNWKLVGKREMFVPYNANNMLQPKSDSDILGKSYPNPDHVRWELHRMWVVDATLKDGQRHQATRSRYYCDEDTWQCIFADRWDGKGQLWKSVWSINFVAPDLPGTVTGAIGFNDFISGTAFLGHLFNSKPNQYSVKPRFPAGVFSPEALASESVR